jgi:hypothetical protein
MFNQPTKKPVIRLVSAASVLALAAVFVALPRIALARIMKNTIDPVAVVADNGRHLIVTGPILCDQVERVELRVTVTQRETGAVAEGYTIFSCTVVVEEQWEVHAVAHGKAAFEEGPAIAVAVASTSSRRETTDAHQWLVDITLEEE